MIHIIIIGNKHFFKEFSDAIALALKSKGYQDIKQLFYIRKQVELGNHKIEFSKDINIISTPQNIEERYVLPKNGSINIWIQTEQNPKPTSYNKWSKVLTLFKDLENDNRAYFSCGYSDAFVGNKIVKTETHKYFSFGAATPYRKKMANRFGVHHERVCFGEKRNTLIRKADINVNIKAFNAKYFFPPLHALHIICNSKLLFQHRNHGNWSLWEPYFVSFTNNSEFKSLSKKWLSDKDRLTEQGVLIKRKLMKNIDFTEQFLHCTKGVI